MMSNHNLDSFLDFVRVSIMTLSGRQEHCLHHSYNIRRFLFRVAAFLKIILWTGYSEKIDRNIALSLGIKEYLEKPFQKKQMLATVRSVLDG